MQHQSVVRASRVVSFVRAHIGAQALLLLAALCWSSLASAAVSPFCPTQTLTVANSSSVTTMNLAACDGPLNIGMAPVTPLGNPFSTAHGTVTVGPQSGTGNQTATYVHNGDAATSDTFGLEDENGDILTFNVTITPGSPITVSPAALPTLTAGTSFSQTLTSTGGTAPYTYSLSVGTLPVGLSLSAAGVLSGTPTQRGTYSFSVRSQDSLGIFSIKGYTGTVQNPTLSISPVTATAIQSVAFSQALTASGGVAPHTYLLETGTFPAGISISSAGVISGTTAAAAGNYPVTIRVTDSSTGPGSYFELKNFTLVVSPPPSVSISVAPASVAEDGATNLVFTVTRSLNLSSATVVNLTAAGTATSGTDYTGFTPTVTIPAGATTATITIDPTVDATIEPDETVTLIIGAGAGYTVGTPSNAVGTILNDDVPSVSIAVAPASVAEDGAPNLIYTVTLSGAANNSITVNITTGGTATSGTDYTGGVATLTIPTGNTTGTITINPTADATIEADETVILTVAAGTGYTVGAPASATGTILNDDVPSVSIAVAPASVTEDGAPNLIYTVTLSAAALSATTVNITTGGTATSGIDYTGGVATLTIPAGNTTGTITINPTTDGTIEADETVILTVAAGTGYTVGAPASATGTILNDDVPSVSIAVAPASVLEDGAPNLIYTVTLNQAALTPTSVNFTVGGTATSGTDYAAVTSPLVIPAGNTTGTITVNPTADVTIEADETVILTLAAGTGYTVGVPASATGTILNDDLPNLTINDVTVSEGNAGTANFTFTVSLSAPAGPGGVTFDIATANGTATAGVDYVANTLTGQTIPAGSSTYTFTVQVNGDTLNEPSETFFVNVTNVTGAVVVDGQGLGTITNDDPLPSLSINNATVIEGNAGTVNATFTVTLSTASGQIVTVNYATADGTATAPSDYTSTSGTLTFTPGQTSKTVNVAVNGDTVPEANETFTVALSAASNATIATATGTGTITNDDVPVTVSPGSLPNGTVAAAYSQTITASGGVAPYGFAVTAGALPAGLTLSSGGLLSGTPTAGGTFNFTVTATDSSGAPGPFTGSQAYTLIIAPPTISLPATTLAGGTLGSPYSAAITPASGGTAPYAYAVTTGALPGGLNLNASSGAITGTPSALGTFNFTVTATDSSTGTGPYTASRAYSIAVIAVPPVASNSSLTVAYNAAATNVPLSLSGGTPTSLAIGAAPLHGSAIVSGLTITYQPTAGYAGPDSFTYTATNSGGTSAPATVTVTVSAPVITITASGGFAATVGTPYTQTFTWSGGATPYSGFQVTNLPAGLSITGTTANSATISGTPTRAGSFSLNASATDSSTGTGPFSVGQLFTLTVAAPTLALTPASGTAFTGTYNTPFSRTFTASGGIGPYTYAYSSSGPLPPGFTFNTSTGVLSGTPSSVINNTFTITATDTGSSGTGAPFTVANNYSLFSGAPTVSVSPATIPNATPAVAYSQQLTATGGLAPYVFQLRTGSLPTGITLSSTGLISGTTTQVGTFNFTIRAIDTNGFDALPFPAYTLVVNAPTLSMTPAAGTLTAPYAAPYSQTFTASGSPGPYSYVLTGALPTGVTFSGGVLSGTPTVPGSYPITVTATDTALTGTGAPFSIAQNYTLNVPVPTIVVNPATLPNTTAGLAYSQTISATGGVAPYSFSVTVGSLPTGLTLSTGGALSGTTTASGTFNFTVTARDANNQPATRAYTVVVAVPTLSLTPGTLPAGTAGTPYSQALTLSGGIAPYTVTQLGPLPAGVTFNAATRTFSGTPTAAGTFNISVTATDSTGGTAATITNNYSLVIASPTLTLSPVAGALPGGTGGVAYSQTFTASGGIAPYSYTLSAGALPAGLTLSNAGVVSGTPTVAGTFNFSVRAIDSTGITPGQITNAYTLTIAAPTITVAPATLPNGARTVAYTQTVTASGGTAPYSFTLSAGALPTGLVLSTAGALTGTPTVVGTYNFTVRATDALSFTGIRAYTVVIAELPPVAVNDTATTLGAAPVNIAVTLNDTGVFTSIAIAAAPTNGTAVVSGLNVTYTAAAGFSGTDTFRYTLTGPGGSSTATVTITVNPIPVAVSRTVNAASGLPVTVDLTQGATGGPFTAANLIALTPSTSGSAVVALVNGSYHLTYTPLTTFSGVATVQFTLSNAFATSAQATITFNVAPRPDPSKDAEVLGLLESQIESTRRFATSQINNFQQRLEKLHGAGSGAGFENAVSFSTNPYCVEKIGTLPGHDCDEVRSPTGSSARKGAHAAVSDSAASTSSNGSHAAFWAGGVIRSGNQDGRGGGAGIDFESDGLSVGADYSVNKAFAIGVGIGYGRDNSDIGRRDSRVEGRAYTAALYASYHPGESFFLDGLFGYQSLSYDLRRTVTVNGNRVFGQRDGQQWFGSLSAGVDIQRDAWQFTPYARIDLTKATLDGYTERGDALYALQYNKLDVNSNTGSVGIKIDYRKQMTWGTFAPQFRAEYQHDFKDGSTAIIRYADQLGPFYRADLQGFNRNRFTIGLGALFSTDDDWSFRIEYRGQLGGETDNGLLLNVEKKY